MPGGQTVIMYNKTVAFVVVSFLTVALFFGSYSQADVLAKKHGSSSSSSSSNDNSGGVGSSNSGSSGSSSGSSDNSGGGGSGSSDNSGGGSGSGSGSGGTSSSSNSAPSTSSSSTSQTPCSDGSQPDANGNCPPTTPPSNTQKTASCPDGFKLNDTDGKCIPKNSSTSTTTTTTTTTQMKTGNNGGNTGTNTTTTTIPSSTSVQTGNNGGGNTGNQCKGLSQIDPTTGSCTAENSSATTSTQTGNAGTATATTQPSLTQQTCPPLPLDANGKCPGVDIRGGGLGPQTIIGSYKGTGCSFIDPTSCASGNSKENGASGLPGSCLNPNGLCILPPPDSISQQGNCQSGAHMINGDPNNCADNYFPYDDGTCPPGRMHKPGPDQIYCSSPCTNGAPPDAQGQCPKPTPSTGASIPTTQTGNTGGSTGGTTNAGSTTSAPMTTPMKTGGGTSSSTGAGTTSGATTNTSGTASAPMTTPMKTGGGAATSTGTGTAAPTSGTGTSTSRSTTTTTKIINNNNIVRGGGPSGSGSSSVGGTQVSTATPSITYVNIPDKITIRYPSTWTKTEFANNPNIPVIFNAPINGTTTAKTTLMININNQLTPSSATPDAYTKQQIDALTNSSVIKYTITDTNSKVLTPPAGITAYHEISYNGIKNNTVSNNIPAQIPLKGTAIFFVNGNTGYTLLYLAKQSEYNQNLPIVQQMINTFQMNATSGVGVGAGPTNTTGGNIR